MMDIDPETLALATRIAQEKGYISLWSPAREKREQIIREAQEQLRHYHGSEAAKTLEPRYDDGSWI